MARETKQYGAAVACTTEQTLLGEGVRWDARRDELLRVDILLVACGGSGTGGTTYFQPIL